MMKFYDMDGNSHNTQFGAVMGDVRIGVGDLFQKVHKRKKSVPMETKRFAEEFYEPIDPYPDKTEPVEPASTLNLSPNSDVTVEPTIVAAQNPAEKAAPPASVQKIEIDYAHKQIQLVDGDGKIIATSPLDDRLVAGTIDKAILDVLYPDGKVPEEISMNVQSLGNTTSSDSIYDDSIDGVSSTDIPDSPTGDFPMG